MPNNAGNGKIDERIKRFQQFIADLPKTGADAYRGHLDALLADNDRLMHSFQGQINSQRRTDLGSA